MTTHQHNYALHWHHDTLSSSTFVTQASTAYSRLKEACYGFYRAGWQLHAVIELTYMLLQHVWSSTFMSELTSSTSDCCV